LDDKDNILKADHLKVKKKALPKAELSLIF
jgi:hypothetical protein